jgi:hypothetical protein
MNVKGWEFRFGKEHDELFLQIQDRRNPDPWEGPDMMVWCGPNLLTCVQRLCVLGLIAVGVVVSACWLRYEKYCETQGLSETN